MCFSIPVAICSRIVERKTLNNFIQVDYCWYNLNIAGFAESYLSKHL
jgi:hypothetical protein